MYTARKSSDSKVCYTLYLSALSYLSAFQDLSKLRVTHLVTGICPERLQPGGQGFVVGRLALLGFLFVVGGAFSTATELFSFFG